MRTSSGKVAPMHRLGARTTPIIAATKILESGQSETLRIPAIRDAGTYEFVCTFPGHWVTMCGTLVVTKDPAALLAAAAPAAPAAMPGSHRHP